jgi:hypothetical protein
MKNLFADEIKEMPDLLRLSTLHIVLTISFVNLLKVQQINKLNHRGFTEDGKK